MWNSCSSVFTTLAHANSKYEIKQRTRKFVTKILRKTCSSLVKIISDGDNYFTQNRYNKLEKKCFFAKNMYANMRSSTVQLHGVDLTDMRIKNLL